MSNRGKSLTIDKAKRRKRTSKKKELDINKLVNIAVKTGKTILGSKAVRKHINTNDIKMIIVSQNCPNEIKESFSSFPIYSYPFSSWELGTAAGKPFMVASLGIIDQGDSGILEVIQKIKQPSSEK